jgi:hypothetical protein
VLGRGPRRLRQGRRPRQANAHDDRCAPTDGRLAAAASRKKTAEAVRTFSDSDRRHPVDAHDLWSLPAHRAAFIAVPAAAGRLLHRYLMEAA